MKGTFKKVISFLLVAVMVASVVIGVSPRQNAYAAQDKQKVGEFVERCYTVILNRQPDANGKADWVNRLLSGEISGIECAQGFVFSPEYRNKNKTDEEYLTDLYNTFLGRSPDKGGFDGWMQQLAAGADDCYDIFNGFACSNEFKNICDSYGIRSGERINLHMSARANGYGSQRSENVGAFVDRCYNVILGREPDAKGKAEWVNKLLNGEISGIKCAYGFVFSQEYASKNKTNEQFVTDLYKTFLGRNPDAAGKAGWLNKMANGADDCKDIFNGFACSNEFKNICNSYGIVSGDPINEYKSARSNKKPAIPTSKPTPTVNSGSKNVQKFTITTSSGTVVVEGYFDEAREDEIVNLLNAHRVEHGLKPLVMTDDLRQAARMRSVEVCYYFSHVRPNGTRCFTVYPDGYGYKAENIAAGRSSAQATMSDWKASSGHNANMLSSNFSSVGVGCFVCTSNDDAGGLNNYKFSNYYTTAFGG